MQRTIVAVKNKTNLHTTCLQAGKRLKMNRQVFKRTEIFSLILFVIFAILLGCESGVSSVTPQRADDVFSGEAFGGWGGPVFEDQFSGVEVDETKWDISNSAAFGSSKATFHRDSVTIVKDGENSYLEFTMTNADDPAQNFDKDFRGAQIVSKETFKYRKFSTHMKSGKGSGQISAFFTYGEGNDEHGVRRVNEIDFEILGEADNKIQVNNWFDPSDGHLKGNGYLARVPGISTIDDYQEYAFIWLEDENFFYLNGKLIRYTDEIIPQLPCPLLFNFWMAGYGSVWGGFPDSKALPSKMSVDWVKVWAVSP